MRVGSRAVVPAGSQRSRGDGAPRQRGPPGASIEERATAAPSRLAHDRLCNFVPEQWIGRD
jgi:hypothetical protein